MATQSSHGPGQDCLDGHRFWRLESWKNKKWDAWDRWSANNDFQFFMEQTHIHNVQFPIVLVLKISTCLSQPREARPRWAWWRDRRPAAPRACSHSGSRRPTPRSPRWTWPTWGTNVSHKWPTWVVVRTIADKTSKSSPCDEEGSPCQSLPLGNSGSCQVLQPLGIATTHLVWNIFYTISRNCKKHLSVVFKNDFLKLLNPIFLKYLARDFQYFNGMAIRLIDSWTWFHFWSLFGFFWTKAKYAMRLNAWVSAGQLERGPDEFATFSQMDRQRSLAFDRNNQYSLLWRVPESGPAGFGDLSTNR